MLNKSYNSRKLVGLDAMSLSERMSYLMRVRSTIPFNCELTTIPDHHWEFQPSHVLLLCLCACCLHVGLCWSIWHEFILHWGLRWGFHISFPLAFAETFARNPFAEVFPLAFAKAFAAFFPRFCMFGMAFFPRFCNFAIQFLEEANLGIERQALECQEQCQGSLCW